MQQDPSNPRHYGAIGAALLDEPWAIQPTKLEAITEIIARKSAGELFPEGDLAQAVAAAAPPSPGGRRDGVVAVLPVMGVLRHRLSLLAALFGATGSVEQLSRTFDDLVADEDVRAIVLDIDSPGGSVSGITEFAQKIRKAREVKPIVAVANTLAASAAYHLAAQATEVVASPSAIVGSIGAFMVHADWSKFDERVGVKWTLIQAGKFKTEGNPFEPLTTEAREHFQEEVDAAFDLMARDIAAGRNVSVADVRGARFGEGRVFDPRVALERGLIDRIATRDETIARLQRPQGRGALVRSEQTDLSDITARLDGIEARLDSLIQQEDAGDPFADVDADAIADALGARMTAKE